MPIKMTVVDQNKTQTSQPNPFRTLIDNAPDLIWIIDQKRRINFVSPAVTQRLGWTPGTLIGAQADILIPPEELDLYTATLHSVGAMPGNETNIEMQILRNDGSRCWVNGTIKNLSHHPDLAGVVMNVRDIDERMRYEDQLLERDFFDALTGLATRDLFVDRLNQAIRLADNDLIVKVLFIDIDNFAVMNKQLGFGPGDEILRQVAERLQQKLPESTIIGRFGNDRFLVAQVSNESNRGELVTAVTRSFQQPFQIGEHSIGASASIGLTTTSKSGITGKELIKQAATAAHEAKRLGGAQAITYTRPLNTRAIFKRETESQLRTAVDNGELRIHYQPIVEARTERAVGIEALVRWEHPTRGLIPPSEFITIAEETGMIVNIGYWVIDQTVELVASLNANRARPLFGVVNMSPRQLSDQTLAQRAHMALTRSRLEPHLLHLDVTEASLQGAQTRTGQQLHRLTQLGIELAIDDFGAGATSFDTLRDVPATYLKVDRSYTNQITAQDHGLVAGIVSMARALGLVPMAEGVENQYQLNVLTDLGCEYSQGYLHGRPLPTNQLIEFLADDQAQVNHP